MTHAFVFLLIALSTCAAAADATPAADTPENAALGRLFHTPAQRTALDEMRRQPDQALRETQPPSFPAYVTLNGVVQRSDGTTTLWLNGKQIRGREPVDGLQISSPRHAATPGSVTVRMPQTGHAIDLKVGQRLETDSGTVKERYHEPQQPAGAISQAPPPQEPLAHSQPASRKLDTSSKPARKRLLPPDDPPDTPDGTDQPRD